MITPISLQMTAASAAVQLKSGLYRLHPARTAVAPDYSGGNAFSIQDAAQPITDKSYWEGRYALCALTLRRPDGRTLEMVDAVCSIGRQRNIVTTAMVGMDGTIKEYINEGDYQLNILLGVTPLQGGSIADEYPEEELRELRAFLDTKEALEVHSAFLDIFDIGSIVIKDFSVQQDTASNYQQVSISALSDEGYNIFSTEY